MRRVLYCSDTAGTSTLRRCGAYRAVGHQLPRCPLYLKGEVQCDCGSPSCPQCAVSCAKCGAKGHSEDTLVEAVRKGTPARFACPQLDEEAVHDRMMRKAPPTARAQREVAQAGKKRLAEISCNSGSRLTSHLRQSALVDELGLGGAAATAPVRMSEGVAAALEDDGAPRAASRMLGAFVADSAAHGRGGASQPPPGPLETLVSDVGHKAMIENLKDGMSKRPRYSSDQRTAMRRRAAEAGLQAARGGASSVEIMGSANPYFGVMSLPLKRAAVRYVQLFDGPILNKVKRAMDEFIVEKAYHGGSVTSQEFTTEQVCAELMGCAGQAELQLPSVLASMRQFIKEIRQGEEDLRPFVHPAKSGSPRRPTSAELIDRWDVGQSKHGVRV